VQVAQHLGCLPEEILDFAGTINPLGTSRALRQLWRPAEAWRLLQAVQRYPDPESRLLRQAIAEAVGIEAEGVIPGNGSAELWRWVAQEIAALGVERVLTLAPHPCELNRVLATVGRSPIYIPGLWATEDVVLSKVVAQAEGQPFAMLASNPHDPTGQLYSRELWQQILALPNCALLAVDESLMDFCEPGASLLPAVAYHPNLVVLQSLTKFYAIPGLRIGFAAVAAAQGPRWQERRSPWNINAIAEQAALVCLGDREYQAATRLWLPPARDRLYRGLQTVPGLTPYSSAAHFLLVRCDRPAQAWQEFLLYRHRILVKTSRSFAGLGDRHLRIAVRLLSEQDQLLAALAEAKLG
jgi:histidinol-phosphate/aromatic aminotransferase/cobyric acid decarboxylase-like protein